MPFIAKGHGDCQVEWSLGVDGLLLGPSATGRFASFEPVMGKGIVWKSMVCTSLSE